MGDRVVFGVPHQYRYVAWFEEEGGWFSWPAERGGWASRQKASEDDADPDHELPAPLAELALLLSGVDV